MRAAIANDAVGSVEHGRVLFRRDGESRFSSVPLVDSGNRGWFGTIPAQPDGVVVEYLVEATSSDGAVQRWPRLVDGNAKDPTASSVGRRQALHLFQVDDGFSATPIITGEQNPFYKIIMPKREVSLLRSVAGRSSSNSVYNNRYHGTFVSVDPNGTRVRHLCSMRIRGNGSRSAFPPGLRLSFASDDLWKGVQNINLNSQHPHAQVLGAAIHQVMGFPAARATAVRLTINGEDWTRSGLPQFGHYTWNEVLDSDYVEARFASESDGNLYRGVGQANLNDRGDQVSNYRTYYRKRNHAARDDYSDVMQLCKVLDRNNDTSISEPQFLAEVNEIADIDQWMRYFALDALLCNLEGGFPTGRGDDYAMFRGGDGRFRLLPYDLDSILGRGEPGEDLTKSIFSYGNTRGLRRLFKNPEVIRLYFRHIRDFVETSYRPEVINRIIDEVLGSWVPASEIEEIKAFVPRRIAAVLGQIEGYTVAGSTLEYAGGFHRTKRPGFLLYGRFDPSEVVEVRVNGRSPSRVDLRAGTWTLRATAKDPLVSPGITPVVIEMRGSSGNVVDRAELQVWYDNGKMTEIEGVLPPGESRWDAKSGPYLITGELVVPDGAALHVEAGTSVFFSSSGAMRVSGKLDVAGTESHPVRFAAPVRPGSGDDGSVTWRGIVLDGAEPCSIAHAGIDGVDGASNVLDVTDTAISLRKVAFGRAAGKAIVARNAEIRVADCKFVSAREFVSTAGGVVVIEDSEFGEPSGEYSVVVGGLSEMPARVKGNTFSGGGSGGGIRLETDAVVTKNLFGSGSSTAEAAVVTANLAEVVVAGNGFLGWKAAISVGGKGRSVFEKNTLRFCSEAPLSGDTRAVEVSANLVAPAGAQIAFRQPDSAWPAGGRKASWELLELNEPDSVTSGAHLPLLAVHGVPPTGKSAPAPREVTFRYPGGKGFRLIGSGDALEVVGRFTAKCTVNDGSRIGVEVIDLTGAKIAFPDAASWETHAGHKEVMISEVLAVNRNSYAGNNRGCDAVELYNYGATEIDLGGYSLTDDPADRDKFVFPSGALIASHGYAVVELGVRDAVGKSLEAEFGLNRAGEQLLLYAPGSSDSTDPIDSVRFGRQIADFSIGRVGSQWQLCKPTLGEPNKPVRVAGARSVRLNEWLAAGGSGTTEDFIELRNTASIPADVSGCGLTDNISNAPFRYKFASLSYIPADGIEAFYATGKLRVGQLDFKLSDDGEVLGFVSADGAAIDWVAFKPQGAGRSQGRDASGNLVSYSIPSPGTVLAAQAIGSTGVLAESLRFAEIHYNPEGDGDSEFLELVNLGTRALDLSGVRVAGGVDFVFQEGAALDPYERLVLVRDRKAFQMAYGDVVAPVGEYSGKLSNGGEKLRLESPGGIPIQQLEFSDKWHKITDGGGKSLEAKVLSATVKNWSRKKAWRAGDTVGGTPGQ